MPIYEFACPKCRVVFNFLSRRVNPDRLPVCPKCGNNEMVKQMSGFATLHRSKNAPDVSGNTEESGSQLPDIDDARMAHVMNEMERDMAHLDENNPRHLAHMMRKMKDLLPPGAAPTQIEVAIKRLEAGEDPEKIEADMGDIFGDMPGGEEGVPGGRTGRARGYSHDAGLYDY
jgi:putative FmdB family regulatory protein